VQGASTVEEEAEAQTDYVNPLTENVRLEIDERVSCLVNKDGDISKFELKGIVYLTITDPKQSHAEIRLDHQEIKGLSFKVHPELDKQAWNKQKLIKAKGSGDPQEEGLSTQTKLDALRYRYTSKDEENLPFAINVFNSKKQGKNVVTIEVEWNQNQGSLKFKAI